MINNINLNISLVAGNAGQISSIFTQRDFGINSTTDFFLKKFKSH